MFDLCVIYVFLTQMIVIVRLVKKLIERHYQKHLLVIKKADQVRHPVQVLHVPHHVRHRHHHRLHHHHRHRHRPHHHLHHHHQDHHQRAHPDSKLN